MKIYNYSDKPIYIHGVPTDDHIVYLYHDIERWNAVHNDRYFINTTSEERNVIYTITNTNTGYKYKKDVYAAPDVWIWITILITFWGFWFTVKILQKLKLR